MIRGSAGAFLQNSPVGVYRENILIVLFSTMKTSKITMKARSGSPLTIQDVETFLPAMAKDVSGTLIQMARIALDWKQTQLAEAAGCNVSTIGKVERGHDVNESTRAEIVRALESAGIVFIPGNEKDGAGLRWGSAELQQDVLTSVKERELAKLATRKKPR